MSDSAPPYLAYRLKASEQTPPASAHVGPLLPSGKGGRPHAPPPLEELLHLLSLEIVKGRDAQQTAELKVRVALLLWDGRARPEEALRRIEGVEHPVATALRLQAALDAPDNAALLHFADEVQRRGDGEDMAEVGELLL